MKRLLSYVLHAPFVHFLAGGLVVYVGGAALTPSTDLHESASSALADQKEPHSVEDELVLEALRRGLHDDFVVRNRIAANRAFLGSSDLSAAVLESMTWRDPIVRRRLLQRLRIAHALESASRESDRAAAARPGWRAESAAATVLVSFDERFFSPQGSAVDARELALRALDDLRAGTDTPGQPARVTLDPPMTLATVARYLGEEFATALGDAPLREWIGPIRSAQGWHVVRIHERRAP